MQTICDSSVGRLEIMTSRDGVCRITFLDYERSMGPRVRIHTNDDTSAAAQAYAEQAQTEVLEFLDGTRTEFTVPVASRGTEFQHAVWEKVAAIPFGATRTYGDIAKAVGAPKASRAVGAANGANPTPIIVPCHRVVGSNGKLTGYAYGLPLKEKLLALENRPLL